VENHADPVTLQGALASILLTELHKDGHVHLRPLDLEPALPRKAEILNLVLWHAAPP